MLESSSLKNKLVNNFYNILHDNYLGSILYKCTRPVLTFTTFSLPSPFYINTSSI